MSGKQIQKEKFQKKVKLFTVLIDDIANDIELICKENKEDEYKDLLIEMIQALDRSQQTVKRAYNLFISKSFTKN
ncbi:hypothetical protein LCGC14_1593660 [marine sediment metagenome]|uniref:Uncharacterized protein n=1 Tax=marine sediment metagenome TaxID=412755 RepID=A0A0F9ID82_9ZZZZ